MKTIWFKSDTILRDEEFVIDCRANNIDVIYGINQDSADYETLIVTNDEKVFFEDNKCLVAIDSEEDMNRFPGAKYFVMAPQDNETEYFVRIWQRLNGLPWIISETEHLTIRETVEEDLEALVEMYKDPSMTEFTEPLYETEAERRYITQYREQVYEIQGFGIWSLISKKNNKLIGRAGLVSRNDYDGLEIGFAIAKDFRKKGYACEAVNECLKLAKLMEFDRVRALVMPENVASVNLLKKLSFESQGVVCINGESYEMWEIVLR